MNDFLANLEASITEEAEETPETPEEETETPEGGENPAETPAEIPEEGQEPEEEQASAPKPEAITDETEIEVDGNKVTLKDLKKGYMMQADYTRKTQALADKDKKREEELTETKENVEDLEEWVSGLQDADTMYFELTRHFPDVFDALKDRIIEEALDEQDMSPRERDAHRRARRMEISEQGRKKDEEKARIRAERRAKDQRTTELTRTFDGWMREVLAETGLEADDAPLVKSLIVHERRGERWTRDTFLECAQKIAKKLGRKPAETKKDEPPKKQPKLPPVRTTGAKGPSVKTQEKRENKNKPKSSEAFFEELRRKNGLRA